MLFVSYVHQVSQQKKLSIVDLKVMGDISRQLQDLDDLIATANAAGIPELDANAIRQLEEIEFIETDDLALPPASG